MMAARVPIFQEEIDVIKSHLINQDKLTSAEIVQDMFNELLRLYKCAGFHAFTFTVPPHPTQGTSEPKRLTVPIASEAGEVSDITGPFDETGRSSEDGQSEK